MKNLRDIVLNYKLTLIINEYDYYCIKYMYIILNSYFYYSYKTELYKLFCIYILITI